MIFYGTHSQPPGTWSDGSSMMLCTLENIGVGGSMETITNKLLASYRDAYMTHMARSLILVSSLWPL